MLRGRVTASYRESDITVLAVTASRCNFILFTVINKGLRADLDKTGSKL